MKSQFKRKVDSGDIVGVRISLANEMMLDPRGDSFSEMRSYAESALNNLYIPHDGAILDANREHWNEDLLFATKNALDDNFSRERLDYYYELAQIVLHEKAEQLRRETRRSSAVGTNPTHRTQRPTQSEKSEKSSSDALMLGLTIGGLFVGGAGLIMGRALITAIGVAGAAIGGGMLYQNKNK